MSCEFKFPPHEEGNRHDANHEHDDDIRVSPSAAGPARDGQRNEDQGKDGAEEDEADAVESPEEVEPEGPIATVRLPERSDADELPLAFGAAAGD